MSNTNITTTTETTTVVVEENIVRIELNNIGVQGVPGANNDPVYVTVRNATGSLMTKGSIVYVSGGNGVHTQVSLALATSDATSARVLGWLSQDIANNADGLCMVEGYLDGVDTQGVTQGAQLYLSGTTAGAYQVTKPVAPIHLVYVGVAVKAASGNGRVYVKVQNGYELDELHDVLIVSPQNNQVLAYDSATQLWKNAVNAPDGVTSITAVSPLTGGTITSTGSIGLDQTALSITRSQVSDFTSGTVTSASTAQQAGTAVYAVNSGTAVYATTSGTAVYSVNSGTAVTISGSITKSQVSDFTSGTVAQADNATTSGTAVYATNSGTAVFATTAGTSTTISGDITRSQVSDFASGTVAQAGTATYAVNSGTAVYANTSGTATFATNSGTAVFATNASTAVSVSGSAITQSQVVNLVSDLANTAKLNDANTFSVGGHVINNAATGTVPIRVNAIAGQTANLFEIRDSAATNYVAVNSAGSILFGGNSGSFLSGANGRVNVQLSGDNVGLTVRGFGSQTADLVKIQNSSGVDLVRVDSAGRGIFPTVLVGALTGSIGIQMAVQPTAPTIPGFAVRGAASQTANLQEWQESNGGAPSQVNATGQFRIRSFAQSFGFTALGVAAGASTEIGAVIRGAASQSANLLEIQSSAGTILSRFDSGGNFVASNNAAAINSGTFLLGSRNSGAELTMVRQNAAPTNPGANLCRIYFRDGTNAGTLRLVVRAGAAGAETTVLDNIPQ